MNAESQIITALARVSESRQPEVHEALIEALFCIRRYEWDGDQRRRMWIERRRRHG